MQTNPLKSTYSAHIQLPENTQGRDYIVADLHGYRAELDLQLQRLNFNPEVDRLISVGDLIDRGPDSPGCIALLDEPWFYTVRGNHEQLLIDSIRHQSDKYWSRWLMNGGSWVLEHPDIETQAWCDAFEQLPLTITLGCQGKTIGLCHAEYTRRSWQDRLNADEQLQTELIWGRSRLKRADKQTIEDIDWLFCGHTVVKNITTLGNTAFIERGVYLEHPLTIINLQQWLIGR